jgi:hypothetical protein
MKPAIPLCIVFSQPVLAISGPRFMGTGQPVSKTGVAKIDNSRKWRPATYRGLTMGKSKVADMRRVFGAPTRVERFNQDKSNPQVWYHYDGIWEFPGTLRVILDKTRTVREVHLLPKNLRKEEAIKHFGPD